MTPARRLLRVAITLAVLAALGAYRVRAESRYWPHSHDTPMSWFTAGKWAFGFLLVALSCGALVGVILRLCKSSSATESFWTLFCVLFLLLAFIVPSMV